MDTPSTSSHNSEKDFTGTYSTAASEDNISRDNANKDNSSGDKSISSSIISSSSAEGEGDGEEMDLEWEEWDPSRLSFLDHMLAGSFAGLAEHVSIFPMDTLKTNMQCDSCDNRTRASSHPFKTIKCAKRIVKTSGVLRLWRGVSAMFAGCIPAHAAYFSLFESMKVALGADREGHYPLHAAVCGASATLVHDLMMTPFDVVKQRMQLGYHRSVLDCARYPPPSRTCSALCSLLPPLHHTNPPSLC
jgi:solute carrier family 25 (mitochondrial iron transporter), member 28/37